MKRYYLFWFLLAVMAEACSDARIESEQAGASKTLKGTLTIPPSIAKNTWSRSPEDNAVSTIDILVFANDSIFLERVTAKNITPLPGSANRFSYEASFSVNTVLSDERNLHYLVNAELSGYSAADFSGKHEGEVRAMLVDRKAYNESETNRFTMWGNSAISSVSSLANLPQVEVTRDVAKIDIAWNDITHFACEGITLYNTLTTGMMIPSTPTTLTEPASAIVNEYAASVTGTNARVYAYERAANSTPSPYLILKGKYRDNSVATYYKIAIGRSSASGYRLLDIKRNHHYTVKILEMDGPGYATLEEAQKYPPFNHISASTAVNEDVEMKDVVTNGQYSLGLTRSNIQLQEPSGSAQSTFISRITVTRVEGVTGEIPSLSDVTCTLIAESDADFITDKTTGNTIDLDANGNLYLNLSPLDASRVKTAKIRVSAGNLTLEINITQSQLLEFEVPAVFYTGWERDNTIDIPVTLPANTPAGDLTIKLESSAGTSGSFLFPIPEMQTANSPASLAATFMLTTSTGYYGESVNQTYRTNHLELSAPGFQTKTIIVKQSKYLDGVSGKGIIGIYRDDDDNAIYPVAFDDTEEEWKVEITQGSDFIRIGKFDQTAMGTTPVNGEHNIQFSYQLLLNTTATDRYGKIVITYGLNNAQHTIYVHQGFDDVLIHGTHWAARNVDIQGNFALLPDYPGKLYQQHATTPYDATNPGVGVNYPGYAVNGNASGSWTISPTGYRVPSQNEIQYLRGQINRGRIGNPVLPANQSIAAYFTKMFFGRLNDPSDPAASPGILLVKESATGEITQTFFLPCPGYRIGNNGVLTSTHAHMHASVNASPYYYTNGIYWGSSSSVIDIYHDPEHNIGLLAPGNPNNFGRPGEIPSLAAPVRCIRQ